MSDGFRTLAASVALWPARRWIAAVAAALVFAVVAGVPTDVLPNPIFDRVVPVQWWNYPILAATALLGGLVVATYVRSPVESAGLTKVTGSGLLSAIAIGCPVCNKLVVLLLGTSGALTIWAPLQPILGLVSLGLLGWALRTRLAAERACPVPSRG
jgi:hypothetical protein